MPLLDVGLSQDNWLRNGYMKKWWGMNVAVNISHLDPPVLGYGNDSEENGPFGELTLDHDFRFGSHVEGRDSTAVKKTVKTGGGIMGGFTLLPGGGITLFPAQMALYAEFDANCLFPLRLCTGNSARMPVRRMRIKRKAAVGGGPFRAPGGPSEEAAELSKLGCLGDFFIAC